MEGSYDKLDDFKKDILIPLGFLCCSYGACILGFVKNNVTTFSIVSILHIPFMIYIALLFLQYGRFKKKGIDQLAIYLTRFQIIRLLKEKSNTLDDLNDNNMKTIFTLGREQDKLYLVIISILYSLFVIVIIISFYINMNAMLLLFPLQTIYLIYAQISHKNIISTINDIVIDIKNREVNEEDD